MRFQKLILAYFVIGTVMWGGGVLEWNETGLAGFIVENPNDNPSVNDETAGDLEKMGGPLQEAAGSLAGPIIPLWNFIIKFLGYLGWPIASLQATGAPKRIVVLLGGSLTTAFLGSVLRLFRSSA
jgi:hypothetical protein